MTIKSNNQFARTIDGFVKEIMNDFPSNMTKTLREEVLHFPPVNIYETPEAYSVEMSVPGYQKNDFTINLENNVLTVSSEKKADAEAERKQLRREFTYRAFKRSFTLDEKINADAISAKYENGILIIGLPKKESVISKRDIEIL